MTRATLGTITVRTSADTKDWFKNSFEASNANSQGDFLQKLLEKWNEDEHTPEPLIQTVTIEKDLQENQILMSLNPAQLFALRGTVTFPNFAELQNEIIETLKNGERPFMSFSRLFEPEFNNLWIRNIVISKTMTEAEKEKAIRHNMTAFLLNMFLVNIIEGNISKSFVTADKLKSYIIQTTPKKEIINTPLTPPKNEPGNL